MNARDLYLIRLVLAVIWLATGVISLGFYPVSESVALLARIGIAPPWALPALYAGAGLDLLLGVLTLCYPRRWLWLLQMTTIVFYTALITLFLPEFWLHPFGPLLKNIPIFLFLYFLLKNSERKI